MLFCLIALPVMLKGQKGPVMSPVPMNVTPTTVTNTVRIVPPGGGIPSPASRRSTPVQAAPTNSAVKIAPSPFLSATDEVVPLTPAGAPPKSTATLTPVRRIPRAATSPSRATPGATTSPTGTTPQVASPVTRPKLPVIAAPRSRNTANSAQNVAGQTASEALVEVSKIVAAQEIDGKPRVHSLVPPEKDLPFDAGAVRFEKMPLVQILELYGEFTGRTLLKGAGLNEQLTVDIVVNQESELMISEVVQAFDIVLNQNQVAIVPVGDKFLLALGAAQAIKEGLPFSDLDRNRMPEAPTLLTKIVQLQYAETKDVVNVIQKFAKVAGGITIVESTKTLIIQDYAINMKRMLELIERIDVAAPANEQIFEVIPVLYAPVSEIADMLGNFTAKGSSFGSARTTGSGRTTSRGGGSSNSSFNRSGNRNTSANSRVGNSTFRPQQATPARAVPTPGSAASQFQQRLRNIVQRAQGDEEPEPLLGNASIGYYERSNSLLVRGTRDELEKVKKMVEELDVVQPQVLIEAIIMDVSLTDNREFGINILQQETKLGANIRTAGGVNNGGGGFMSQFGAATNSLGNAIGSLAGGFSYYGLLGRNWETAIRAVETDSFGTVLSRPQILTTHAEPAELFIGESLPFPSSSGADFTGVSRVSIDQVDIGITLRILPLINPDGLVILEVDQEIESFRGFESFGELRAPRTTRRSASAKIAVNNGETIILGGLISNTKDETDTGTPFLRKVPLLKYFFKQNSKNNLRSELILMLRPVVLETPEIAQASTEAQKMRLPGVRRAEMEQKFDDEKWLRITDEKEMKLKGKSKRPSERKSRLPIDLFDLGR